MVIYEIGVGPFNTCRSVHYWGKHQCVLFEPLKTYYEEITRAIKTPNVQLHNIAIYDYDGYVKFIQNGQLSFIQGLNSPQAQFGIRGGNITSCKCARISQFDKGDIDWLFLDMEGAEWFALKHLISRPSKIVIETQVAGYNNPFLKQIVDWMHNNNYMVKKKVGADTVYIKKHKLFT